MKTNSAAGDRLRHAGGMVFAGPVRVGFGSADSVRRNHTAPFTFSGKILGVAVEISEESYLDLETEAMAALVRD